MKNKIFIFTYKGEIYQSRVNNNNFGDIFEHIEHTLEKKLLNILIKVGKKSFDYQKVKLSLII